MKYDLVFEGGGAKGMVFVGACEEFFQRGHSFGRLLGTSAGSITATLLAAGYSPAELLEALAEKEAGRSVFAGFMGEPEAFTAEELRSSATRRLLEGVDLTFVPGFVERHLRDRLVASLAESPRGRHLLALVERGGWYGADRFIQWLTARLDTGRWKDGTRGFSRMTLSQFFSATGVELSMVASDTTDGTMLVLNHHTAPECPVVWAVRMSMSIPLVWDEVVWKQSWGQYRGRDLAGHVVVDGGLLSNFPIELFISDAPGVTKLMGPKTSHPVLGLLIDEKLPVAKSTRGLAKVAVKPGELRSVQRLQRLVDTATGAHDKMVIDEYGHLVVRLPAQGYGTTEFDMTDARRGDLVRAGRAAMAQHLDTAVPPALPMAPAGTRRGPRRATADTRADRIAGALLGL